RGLYLSGALAGLPACGPVPALPDSLPALARAARGIRAAELPGSALRPGGAAGQDLEVALDSGGFPQLTVLAPVQVCAQAIDPYERPMGLLAVDVLFVPHCRVNVPGHEPVALFPARPGGRRDGHRGAGVGIQLVAL